MATIKSIEEKAKAYDKVLEWATEAHKVCDGMLKEDLEHLFPELKESEDERIRKAIIELVKQSSEILEKKNQEQMIAWLEKQGKNNMGISEATKKKLEDNLNKALEKETPESFNKFLDEQGEQKLTYKIEPKFKVKYADSEYNVFETKDIAGVTFYGIEDEPNHIDYVKADNCEIISGGYGIKENGSPYPTKPAVFSEQKPAWSEEDEAIYYGVIETEQYMLDVVNGIKKFNVGNISIKEECTRELNWLKSLKDRIQPQQEWSEEDEKMLTSILRDIRYGEQLDKLQYDWLKSLRPQKKQEWSKDDEILLEGIIGAASNKKLLNKYQIEWLSNLSPQSHWKSRSIETI